MYYAVDADEIGKRIEALLLANAPNEARLFSSEVTKSVSDLAEYFVSLGAEIIFAAGDGLLARSEGSLALNGSLPTTNGITWSIGIGKTSELATLALKKAKGLGRNRMEVL